MIDVIVDTLKDTLKLLPFLFFAFLIMEYLEHKFSAQTEKWMKKSGKLGPFIGGILGAFPQCGFAAFATNFYAARIITVGTLISVYLSTSDEMLPIMLSQNVDMLTIFSIILIKVIIGIIAGFIIDRFYQANKEEQIHQLCEEEHCDCEHGILKSSIKHTINIGIFVLIINFVLNITMEYIGIDLLSKLFMKDTIFSPFISSLVGLIPNCASSVLLTELYLNNVINFGSLIAGLLTGCGIGILLLFKMNKNIKDNIKILLYVYCIGIISGTFIDVIGFSL